jgi:hypothetical protein
VSTVKLSDFDPKIATTASIVVAVFIVIAAIVTYVVRDSILPLVLDNVYHVSQNIEKDMQHDVASGYSRTFVYNEFDQNPAVATIPQTLLFHYTRSQDAELVLTGNAYDYHGTAPIRVRILVDDVPVATNSPLHRELPIKGTTSMLPKNLFDETTVTENVHVLKIEPERHDGKAVIVLDALVLVSNPQK